MLLLEPDDVLLRETTEVARDERRRIEVIVIDEEFLQFRDLPGRRCDRVLHAAVQRLCDLRAVAAQRRARVLGEGEEGKRER